MTLYTDLGVFAGSYAGLDNAQCQQGRGLDEHNNGPRFQFTDSVDILNNPAFFKTSGLYMQEGL